MKKLLVVALAIVTGFWAGYGLSSYRSYGLLFPEMLRHERAHSATMAIKYVDRIDAGDIPDLRRRLVALAKDMSAENAMPPASYWSTLYPGPLEHVSDAVYTSRQDADRLLAGVRSRLSQICESPPDPAAYRGICGL